MVPGFGISHSSYAQLFIHIQLEVHYSMLTDLSARNHDCISHFTVLG
jgi:hypothetical protein